MIEIGDNKEEVWVDKILKLQYQKLKQMDSGFVLAVWFVWSSK